MQADGLPRWVEDELWNWSRWCWHGEWPHPMPKSRCASAEGGFPSGIDREEDDDEPPPPIRPVNHDRARIVQRLYEAVPLIEQRVIQAEYPRRSEYNDMRMHERHAAASRRLKISVAYYRVALGAFRQRIYQEFR